MNKTRAHRIRVLIATSAATIVSLAVAATSTLASSGGNHFP